MIVNKTVYNQECYTFNEIFQEFFWVVFSGEAFSQMPLGPHFILCGPQEHNKQAIAKMENMVFMLLDA